jgi:hypothetical protein
MKISLLLRPHVSCTPFIVRKKLVTTLIKPYIDYGNIVLTQTGTVPLKEKYKNYTMHGPRYVFKRG